MAKQQKGCKLRPTGEEIRLVTVRRAICTAVHIQRRRFAIINGLLGSVVHILALSWWSLRKKRCFCSGMENYGETGSGMGALQTLSLDDQRIIEVDGNYRSIDFRFHLYCHHAENLKSDLRQLPLVLKKQKCKNTKQHRKKPSKINKKIDIKDIRDKKNKHSK